MAKITREIPDFLKDKYIHLGIDKWDEHKIELPNDKIFYRTVAIMRANPPHVNHTTMLRTLCDLSVHLNINIGSSNKFDNKNPFRAEEREEMLDLALKDKHENYSLIFLPDFDSDEKWFDYLVKHNKGFTEIVSNNQYDLNIYRANQFKKNGDGSKYRKYDILQPADIVHSDDMEYVTGIWNDGIFVPTKKPVYVSGTFVRAAMVNGWDWQNYLDEPVAEYIVKNGLVDRLKEFCGNLKGKRLEDFDDGR